MLNRSDESRYPCLVPDTKGESIQSFTIYMIFAVVYQVEEVSSYSQFTENFYQDIGFCKMLFSVEVITQFSKIW